MGNRQLLKKVSMDLVYTVSAVVILNIVQQLVVQPIINKLSGAAYLGDVLYYLGLTYVFSQMFGTVLGHQRVLNKKNERITNGDFLVMLGVFAVVVFLIGGIDAYCRTGDLLFSFAIALFMVISLLRYYAQVDFRVSMWFKGYLIYYIILSAGYLVGMLAFVAWRQWLPMFILGELAAVLFVVFRGKVLRFERPGPMLKKLFWPTCLLVLAFIFSSGVNYLDRLLIQPILGSVAVSEYYAVSLTGKIINLLVNPLATLLLSYLANRETSNIDLKQFSRIVLISLPVCAVIAVLSCLVSPLIVYVLYPNLTGVVASLNIPVNVGAVIGFAANLFLILMLAETKLSYQLIIRGGCFLIYFVLVYVMTTQFALKGYAYVSLISNTVRFLCAVLCGLFFYKNKGRRVEGGMQA